MAVTLTAPPARAVQAPLTPDDLLALEAEHEMSTMSWSTASLSERSELQGESMPHAELIGAASARILSDLESHMCEGTDRSLCVLLVDCSFTPVRMIRCYSTHSRHFLHRQTATYT